MVNPVKWFNRATGLSNVLTEKSQADQTESVRQQGAVSSALQANPPEPAPLVGAEPAPNRSSKKPRQFAPSIIGSGNQAIDSGSGNKTLIGQ